MMYLARLDQPQQYPVGIVNGEPVYSDCAGCGAHTPIIHGVVQSEDGKVGIVVDKKSGLFHMAVYCGGCFDELLQKGNQDGKQEPTNHVPERQ